MMRRIGGLACGGLMVVLVACGSDSEAASSPDAGVTTRDADDTPLDNADGRPPVGEPYVRPTSADEILLLSCSVAEPCVYTSITQITEGANHVISLEGSVCLLEALAKGTPGRYVHQTEHAFTNGNLGAKHTLVITSDRSVLYTRVPYGAVYVPDGGGTTYSTHEEPADPGQRCTLKPRSYFEGCSVAVNATDSAARGSLAYECAFGDGDTRKTSHLQWFESCVSASPLACE
jgi:hypothetical protein